MDWTPEEKRFLRALSTPQKIQNHLDSLLYNPSDSALSPRYVMLSGDGHCFEGALLAAAALELQGHPPLVVDLRAIDDDPHVIAVYKTKTGWGSVAKSNTTLLKGRSPYYKSIHELVMSYFDLYFNLKGELALYSYSDPINLNRFNFLDWRRTDVDLMPMGIALNDIDHYELISERTLKKLPKVKKGLLEACFLGADMSAY